MNGASSERIFITIANFTVPPKITKQVSKAEKETPEGNETTDIPLIELRIGNRVKVVADDGFQWCYGSLVDTSKPTQMGFFPRSHIRQIKDESKKHNPQRDADRLLWEISESTKLLWMCLRSNYASVQLDDKKIRRAVEIVRELITVWNRVKSGIVPKEEIDQLRMVVSQRVDIANYLLDLPMKIRNQKGEVMDCNQMSITASYKLHEKTLMRISSLASSGNENCIPGNIFSNEKYILMMAIPNETNLRTLFDCELVVSIGILPSKMTLAYNEPVPAINHITEPLTLNWCSRRNRFVTELNSNDRTDLEAIDEPYDKYLRVFFLDLTHSDIHDDGLVFSVQVIRHVPLKFVHSSVNNTSSKKSNDFMGNELVAGQYKVRQFCASGHSVLDILRDMAINKETREVRVNLYPIQNKNSDAMTNSVPSAAQKRPKTSSNVLSAAGLGTLLRNSIGGITDDDGNNGKSPLISSSSPPSQSHSSSLILNDSYQQQKIPLQVEFQLISAKNCEHLYSACDLIPSKATLISGLRWTSSSRVLKPSHCISLFSRLNTKTHQLLRLRNEIFIRLKTADLHGVGGKIGSSAEKSIEAVLSVLDCDAKLYPEAIEYIGIDGKIITSSSFRTRFSARDDRPSFDEVVRIRLPDFAVRNLHLQILFYNRKISPSSLGTKGESSGTLKRSSGLLSPTNFGNPKKSSQLPFALSFLPLIKNYVVAPDEEGELLIYRVEKSDFDVSNVSYLGNCAKRSEIYGSARNRASILSPANFAANQQDRSRNTGNGNSTSPMKAYSLSDKITASFCFQTLVFSEVHTTSSKLLHILRWRENDDIIRQALQELSQSTAAHNGFNEELLKFLPLVLDALFQIANAIPQMHRSVFDAIIYIIRICDEPRNSLAKTFLEHYVEKLFPSATAQNFILQNLIWYIENEGFELKVTDQKNETPVKNNPHYRVDSQTIRHSNASFFVPVNCDGRDRLMPILKSIGLLTRLIISSWRQFCALVPILQLQQQNQSKKEKKDSSTVDNCFGKKAAPDMTANYNQKAIELARSFSPLLDALFNLISGDRYRMTCQNAALKYLPLVLQPLIENSIYQPIELARFVIRLLNQLSEKIVVRQKLHFIGALVSDSSIFFKIECRKLLLPVILDELLAFMPPHLLPINELKQFERQKEMINQQRRYSIVSSLDPPDEGTIHTPINDIQNGSKNESLEVVAIAGRVLTDIISRFFPAHSELEDLSNSSNNFGMELGTGKELEMILSRCFRPVSQTVVLMYGDPSHKKTLHSLFLTICEKMSAPLLDQYFASLRTNIDRMDTLTEFLHLLKDLSARCPSPQQWYQIRYAQVKLFTKLVRFSKGIIMRYFTSENFVSTVWIEASLTCVSIIGSTKKESSKHLAPERINNHYPATDDIRECAANILRSLWFSLATNQKMELCQRLISTLLEIALLPDDSLRELIIPVFCDMFLTSQQANTNSIDIDCAENFMSAFILELDSLMDSVAFDRYVDDRFRSKFAQMFRERVLSNNKTTTAFGLTFVQQIDQLMNLLIEYRCCRLNSDCLELGMLCTTNLIDFYHSIGQMGMHISYLFKLYRLHLFSENYVEAASTLRRCSGLLRWSNDPVPVQFLSRAGIFEGKRFAQFESQLLLKEHLYEEIVESYEKGEHWELAIEVMQELIPIYENILFDYKKLGAFYTRLALLLHKICTEIRMESNYFLVAFYGKKCPPSISGKKFVFRGEKLEQWGAFKERILSSFADYSFVDSVLDCTDEFLDVDDKFIQIIPINAHPSAAYFTILKKTPQTQRLASWYYKHHGVSKFSHTRPEIRPDTKWIRLGSTETMALWLQRRQIELQRPLPNILKFSAIENESELEAAHPPAVACIRLQEANDKLVEMSQLVEAGFRQFVMNLGGTIRGIIQADVGGGIRNYLPFFTSECLSECDDMEKEAITRLKDLLLDHVTLLEYALYVHSQSNIQQHPQASNEGVSMVNNPFHEALATAFEETYRVTIESRFGHAQSILPPGASIRRQQRRDNKLTMSTSSTFDQGNENQTLSLSTSSFHQSQPSSLQIPLSIRHASAANKPGVINCSRTRIDRQRQKQAGPEVSPSSTSTPRSTVASLESDSSPARRISDKSLLTRSSDDGMATPRRTFSTCSSTSSITTISNSTVAALSSSLRNSTASKTLNAASSFIHKRISKAKTGKSPKTKYTHKLMSTESTPCIANDAEVNELRQCPSSQSQISLYATKGSTPSSTSSQQSKPSIKSKSNHLLAEEISGDNLSLGETVASLNSVQTIARSTSVSIASDSIDATSFSHQHPTATTKMSSEKVYECVIQETSLKGPADNNDPTPPPLPPRLSLLHKNTPRDFQ